MNIGIF